jgi:predicted dienelactone hydrolase
MLLALFACTEKPADDTATLDPVAFLSSPGAWNVGYTEEEVSYSAPDGERSLRLALWYPTSDTAGATVSYGPHLSEMPVFEDAEPEPGSYPVLVFSHGHRGYAENSAFLMEHFTSHGWVVAAPDHKGDTTSDDPDRTTEIYYQRPLDIMAVLDHLESGQSRVSGNGFVLAAGHSFGGYTLFALGGGVYSQSMLDLCESDPSDSFCSTMTSERRALFEAGFYENRLSGLVVMAAGDFEKFEAEGLESIELPVLHMTATLDQGPGSEGDSIWAAFDKPRNYRTILVDGGHQSFTDFAGILEQVPIDTEEGFKIIRAYTLAFAGSLQGEDWNTILSGETTVSQSAELLIGE